MEINPEYLNGLSSLLQKWHEQGEPFVINYEGKPAVVVSNLDPLSYQRFRGGFYRRLTGQFALRSFVFQHGLHIPQQFTTLGVIEDRDGNLYGDYMHPKALRKIIPGIEARREQFV